MARKAVMSVSLILASTSATRQSLLKQAGVAFQAVPPQVDEEAIKHGLIDAKASPRDLVDALAEAKAQSLSLQNPGSLVLGGDQVLNHRGRIFSKARSREEAASQLAKLSGDSHQLLSAAVLVQNGQALWRHVDTVDMVMHDLSAGDINNYLDKIGEAAFWSVGSYQLEGLGVSLFKAVKGDFFTVLGLPLIPLLTQLRRMGLYP